MKKNDITIVTSFFDINRKNYSVYPRTNQRYLDDFKFWARIKNKLVVYTDKVMAEKVLEVRRSFGLEDATEVVIIDDYTLIEPEVLERMKEIEKSEYFLNYRYVAETPENKALYNYVMLLKSWCIKDAVDRGFAKGLVAWLDFGYNHGGDTFIDPEGFDFYWDYEFPSDKVTYFQVNDEPTKKPVFYLVQSFDVVVMGAPFIVPAKLASKHYELILGAIETLLDMGLMDDDQILMLMASRKVPNLFEYKKCDWFMPIKVFGNKNLKTREKVIQNESLKEKVLNKLRVIKRNYMYFKRFKKIFFKDDILR